jgi:hypothetical protein
VEGVGTNLKVLFQQSAGLCEDTRGNIPSKHSKQLPMYSKVSVRVLRCTVSSTNKTQTEVINRLNIFNDISQVP